MNMMATYYESQDHNDKVLVDTQLKTLEVHPLRTLQPEQMAEMAKEESDKDIVNLEKVDGIFDNEAYLQ